MEEKKRISDIGKFSEKSVFSLLKNAEGLGKQRVNTFAPQMPAIYGCPHLLRCGFPNWNPQSEFTSDEEKQEFQGFLADGIPALYFCLLVKGLNEISL